MLKVILWLVILSGIGAAAILCLLHWRDTRFISQDFFRQTVAAIVSGSFIALVSFFSAYVMYKIEDRNKDIKEVRKEEERVKDARMEAFLGIKTEVSENRLTLEMEMKTGRHLIKNPLKTSAWDTGKYKSAIETPLMLDGLKLLYDLIEKYNWQVEFLRFKVMEQNLTTVDEEVWKSKENVMAELLQNLKDFEKLTTRESVLLGQDSKESFEQRFGEWEEKPPIPFFKK